MADKGEKLLVVEWRDARRAFIALPAGDPQARAALNRLSEAEDALFKAVPSTGAGESDWRGAIQRVRDQLGQAGGVGTAGAQNSIIEREVGGWVLDAVEDELAAMLASAPAPKPSKDELWRSMVQAHAAAMRMVVDAIEELFGPTASIESEDASLLRGPEPHHRAEGVIEALQRIHAAPAPDTKQEPVAWLIERKNHEGSPFPHWYVEDETGWHGWVSDASKAKRFATKADAEAFPAYRMIASDPNITITEHVFFPSPVTQKVSEPSPVATGTAEGVAIDPVTKPSETEHVAGDVSDGGRVTAELMGAIIPYLAPMVSIDEVRQKLTAAIKGSALL